MYIHACTCTYNHAYVYLCIYAHMHMLELLPPDDFGFMTDTDHKQTKIQSESGNLTQNAFHSTYLLSSKSLPYRYSYPKMK